MSKHCVRTKPLYRCISIIFECWQSEIWFSLRKKSLDSASWLLKARYNHKDPHIDDNFEIYFPPNIIPILTSYVCYYSKLVWLTQKTKRGEMPNVCLYWHLILNKYTLLGQGHWRLNSNSQMWQCPDHRAFSRTKPSITFGHNVANRKKKQSSWKLLTWYWKPP